MIVEYYINNKIEYKITFCKIKCYAMVVAAMVWYPYSSSSMPKNFL